MPTVHTLQGERALETEWRDGELPPLTTIDRLALRLGLLLILRAQHGADRVERAEQARISAAASRATASRGDAFERRAASGPTW